LVDVDDGPVADVCSRLLRRTVVSVEPIHGGRNSRVYRVDCDSQTAPARFAVKCYFANPDDPRDRLGTEYRALQFLCSMGIARVASPVAIDTDAGCAVYTFLPGERAVLRPTSDDDIVQAVDFLTDLRRLAKESVIAVAATASEACFSLDSLLEHVATRADRLRSLPDDSPMVDDLRRFLTCWDATASSLVGWTGVQMQRHGIAGGTELPFPLRTLSPSDFGFHNALRDERGRLAFLDFEYFGWDDPAKTIADFLLHPAMDMAPGQRRAFVRGVLHTCADDGALAVRARIVYPWFGLKWCLILLNEFVPSSLDRRRFAGAHGGRPELLRRQLDRASRLLERVTAEYRQNPYLA
jgi:hypothetical protein